MPPLEKLLLQETVAIRSKKSCLIRDLTTNFNLTVATAYTVPCLILVQELALLDIATAYVVSCPTLGKYYHEFRSQNFFCLGRDP